VFVLFFPVAAQKHKYINVFNGLVFDAHKYKVYFAILQLIISAEKLHLNLCSNAPHDKNAGPSQTDGQIDEHHSNSATICANERIAR